MPPTFAVYPAQTQIWTLILPNDSRLRNYAGVFIIARLKKGVSCVPASRAKSVMGREFGEHAGFLTNGEADQGFRPADLLNSGPGRPTEHPSVGCNVLCSAELGRDCLFERFTGGYGGNA